MTGEYLVLDGAHALACPTTLGQRMTVKKGRGSDIKWKSFDNEGNVWFSATISLFDFKCEKCTDEKVGKKLTQILTEAVRLNSDFLSKWFGFKVETFLDYPIEWGLGSSSSLVYCLSQWADVNPYELYWRTFGGSGYDIACAKASGPIFFKCRADGLDVKGTSLPKNLTDNFYFIYSGKKQDTAESVAHYAKCTPKNKANLIEDVSKISEQLVESKNIGEAQKLFDQHEKIISGVLDMPRIQSSYFSDYWGVVKSLGAWGGDFYMATSDRPKEETQAYFNKKGLDTFFSWAELMV